MNPRLLTSEPDDNAHGLLDRWMVSYADFITVLFILFLAIYVLAPKLQKAQGVETPVHATQSLPVKGDLEGALTSALEPYLKSGELTILPTAEGVALEIRDAALFQAGTADVSPSAVRLLQYIGATLASRPNPIRVEGHTDDRQIRNLQFPSNWELSAARAGRVVRLLEENAVAPRRMSAVGYADTRPISDNVTEYGRAENRRVTLVVLNEAPNAGISH